MRDGFETTATLLIVACAVGMTGLMLRREFSVAQAAASPRGYSSRYIKTWGTFESAGHRVGPTAAKATIVEFIDYECPACRQFDRTLSGTIATVNQEHPQQTATIFVHFPLSMHRFSRLAGQAAECAAGQDRFMQMHDKLFAKQDSFGLKPWGDYADEAGVSDQIAFRACMRDSAAMHRVDAGLAIAEEQKFIGTPTVLINGWLFAGVPRELELRTAIENAIAGKPVINTLRR